VAPVKIDCCLTKYEKEQLREIPLQKPLTNILFSVEDLKLASVKIDELQGMIDKEQRKQFEHFKVFATAWRSVVLTIVTLIVIICCSCCFCKCCRKCAFLGMGQMDPKRMCKPHQRTVLRHNQY